MVLKTFAKQPYYQGGPKPKNIRTKVQQFNEWSLLRYMTEKMKFRASFHQLLPKCFRRFIVTATELSAALL